MVSDLRQRQVDSHLSIIFTGNATDLPTEENIRSSILPNQSRPARRQTLLARDAARFG
jgi:hypothetical protein